jgi:hypothetical protein
MAHEALLSGPVDFNAEDWRSLGTWQGWQRLYVAGLRWAKQKIVHPIVGYLRQ